MARFVVMFAVNVCALLISAHTFGNQALSKDPLPVKTPLEQPKGGDDQNRNSPKLKDPLKPINTVFFHFNRFLEGAILKPASHLYEGVVPAPIRQRIGNVLSNFSTPVYALNHLLQGEGEKAAQQFSRFLVNSTFGIGGVFDAASLGGLGPQKADFDQTLGSIGVEPGPYLHLPLIGPSTFRDASGRFLNAVVDPFNRLAINQGHRQWIYQKGAVEAVHLYTQNKAMIEALKAGADGYEPTLNLYSHWVYSKNKKNNTTQSRPKPSDGW